MPSSRRMRRSEDGDSYVPVLIIGAGASGLAMGYQLKKKLGFEQFRILDRQSGIGGAWWSNRYPGIACDVPTASYSFSFAPNYVSPHLYPTGEEFQKYLQQVADRYQLNHHIQLDTDVSQLHWIEADAEWEATLHHLIPGAGDLSAQDRQQRIASSGPQSVYTKKESIRAKVVVSCVGILVEPNPWPSSLPGRDTFAGEVFHTARWRDDISLNGKDVVVVGAGCSAAQVVPSLLKEPYHVKSLTQVMRAAPWVMPRLEEPFGKEKFAKYAPTVLRYIPILGWVYRIGIHILVELVWATVLQKQNVKWRKGMEKSTLERTYGLIPQKYHQMMTPDYPYGCKRRIFDSEWLTSMHKPNFTLTNRRLVTVSGKHLTLGAPYTAGDQESADTVEQQIPADVIILANGFEGTRWLHPLSVFGRERVSMHDVWRERGGPQAYIGAAIDGFPNFFMAVGPNTANGTASLILTIENITRYITKMIEPVLNGDAAFVEVKKEAVQKWTDGIQRGLQETVFVECTSWYMDENGYNSTLYSGSQTGLTLQCMFPRYNDWTFMSATGRELKRGGWWWRGLLFVMSFLVAAGSYFMY